MNIKGIAIGYEGEAELKRAQQLAQQLQLPIDNRANIRLFVGAQHLSLQANQFSPLRANFDFSYWQKRFKEGKKSGLIRACKPCPGLKIIDATAGWGRDAAILASFGAQVLMIERNPIMAALLQDALDTRDEESKVKMSLSLLHMQAFSYLSELSPNEYPDIIYIDPMHPPRQKKALAKKDLQILQQIIGSDQDALELVQTAKNKIMQKVIVKWPQNAAPLLKPSASIVGKTIRFDIYIK